MELYIDISLLSMVLYFDFMYNTLTENLLSVSSVVSKGSEILTEQ